MMDDEPIDDDQDDIQEIPIEQPPTVPAIEDSRATSPEKVRHASIEVTTHEVKITGFHHNDDYLQKENYF